MQGLAGLLASFVIFFPYLLGNIVQWNQTSKSFPDYAYLKAGWFLRTCSVAMHSTSNHDILPGNNICINLSRHMWFIHWSLKTGSAVIVSWVSVSHCTCPSLVEDESLVPRDRGRRRSRRGDWWPTGSCLQCLGDGFSKYSAGACLQS